MRELWKRFEEHWNGLSGRQKLISIVFNGIAFGFILVVINIGCNLWKEFDDARDKNTADALKRVEEANDVGNEYWRHRRCYLDIKNAPNLDWTKREIDEALEIFILRKDQLCSMPKNDQKKKEFSDLRGEIINLVWAPDKNSNLSYEEQSAAFEYVNERLDSFPDLNELYLDSTVPCW